MRILLSSLIASPFLLLAHAVQEPATVELGDGTVDGSFIEPYEVEWTVINVSADGEESYGGRWTDAVILRELDGTPALKRHQLVFDAEGGHVNTQTHIVEHASLSPIRSHMVGSTGFVSHIEYSDERISGFVVRDHESAPWTISGALEQPAFNWNIFGTLLLGFPLSVGYEARFPYIELAPNGKPPTSDEFALQPKIHWQTFRVDREEEIDIGRDEPVRAFVVEIDYGQAEFRFWLSKQSPYILKLVQTQPTGDRTEWRME